MNSQINRRIVQRRIGTFSEAAELIEEPIPTPGENDLLVELVVAPINPAELLMLEGSYGYGEARPSLPRNAGIEGVGRVIAGATDRVPQGALVSLTGSSSIFSDYSLIPADSAVVLPENVDPDVFALSFVNTQAVLVMLQEWAELERGDWIIQNAANSAYGRVLDAVATRLGFNVVNVVRSSRSRDEIAGTAHGPVVIDGDDLADEVAKLTDGRLPRVGVDAIAGSATGRIAQTLAPGGRVVNYGLLSHEPLGVDTALILFNDITVEGFWMPRSRNRLQPDTLAQIASNAVDIIAETGITIPIRRRYPLTEYIQAFEEAASEGRGGKIVFSGSGSVA